MVIRYVISFMNKDGMRQIAYPCQGRNTSATKIEAETDLEAFLKNNNPQTLQSIFGKDCLGTFEVSAIECYDGHFDPVGCWISEKLNPGQVCLTGPIKDILDNIDKQHGG
jgi:hypothetical protein